jgi:hypothetical protein
MVEWALVEPVARPVFIKLAGKEIDGLVGSDCLVQESNIPKLPFL